MGRKRDQRLDDACAEWGRTVEVLQDTGDRSATQEAAAALARLATELQEKYRIALPTPEEDEREREYYRLSDERRNGAVALSPRVWRHFEDRHFPMIRNVGERTVVHIQWLLRKTGFERQPDAARGILAVPLGLIRPKPAWLRCPRDIDDLTLADLRHFSVQDIFDRYDVRKGDERFIEQMYKRLSQV